MTQQEIKTEGIEQAGTKKKYTTPQLAEYGDLAKLTLGSTGTAGDGGPGLSKPACL